MNLKDKKLPWIAALAAIIVILLVIKFMPGGQDAEGPEVISKRVKIELQDTSADLSGSIEPTTEGAAPMAPVTTAQPVAETPAAPVSVPPPAPVTQPKPVVAQPKIEPKAAEPKPVAVAPAPAVKAEAPKAAKAEKKAVETAKKKTVAAKKVSAAKALVLNIASFTSLSEAQGLAGKLKKTGYNAYITPFTKDSIKWYRVRVGFFASRDEATKAGRAIQAKFKVEKPWIAKPEAAELKRHL